MRAIIVVVTLLSGCGSQPPAEKTDGAAAFDIGAVVASFSDECANPIMVDELFCEHVRIEEMTADGSILMVPTTLAALDGMRDRGQVICDLIAQLHFDGEGRDLGFGTVGVLDREGGNLAACDV